MARSKKAKKDEVVSVLKDELTPSEPITYSDKDILKVEVLKAFMDKYTEKLYEVGKTYEFTYKRIKEIKAKNEKLIKVIEEKIEK